MKYYLKENFHLLYADGNIYDEYDRPVYSYENTTLMFPQIDLYKNGERVGHVKKNFSWFLRNYDLYLDDVNVDTIQQEFTWFKSELTLERLGWTIKGDFFSWDYQIYNEYGDMIANMDQELFRLTQRFTIDIYDEDNEELIILVVLAINQFDKDRDSAASSSAAANNH
jgi:uncharacterized protein YxjI